MSFGGKMPLQSAWLNACGAKNKPIAATAANDVTRIMSLLRAFILESPLGLLELCLKSVVRLLVFIRFLQKKTQ